MHRTPDPILRSITDWLRFSEQAQCCRSTSGAFEALQTLGLSRLEGGPLADPGAAMARSADAAHKLRHCTDVQRAILRQRYWMHPTSMPVCKTSSNGTHVLMHQRACWQDYDTIARRLKLKSGRWVKRQIALAKGAIRRGIGDAAG